MKMSIQDTRKNLLSKVPKKKLNKLQKLFNEYEKSTSKREKTSLFKEVRKRYLPYILRRISNDSQYDREEVLTRYDYQVWHCLETYKGTNGATFETYLYFSIRRIVHDYFVKEKNNTSDRYLSLGNEVLDSVLDLNDYVDKYYT